jgi:hypothetical protein
LKYAISHWFEESDNPDGFALKYKDAFIDYLVDVIVGVD